MAAPGTGAQHENGPHLNTGLLKEAITVGGGCASHNESRYTDLHLLLSKTMHSNLKSSRTALGTSPTRERLQVEGEANEEKRQTMVGGCASHYESCCQRLRAWTEIKQGCIKTWSNAEISSS